MKINCKMTGKMTIVVMCGLPGAGKTTFVCDLQQICSTSAVLLETQCKQTPVKSTWIYPREYANNGISEITCTHVCYDDIIPSNLYSSDTDGRTVDQGLGTQQHKSDMESTWKEYRRWIRACVEQDIHDHLDSHHSQECDIPEGVLTKYRNMKQIHRKFCDDGDKLHIFVIDDNMYFHSMRYEYFQLARKYNSGFAEIHINCSVETAQSRNQKRYSAVLSDTINTMATRFEPPDPLNYWEAMVLTVDAEECCQYDILYQAWSLIIAATYLPVQSEEVDEKTRLQDRIICLQNMIYQADQILRKLIGQEMSQLKDSIDSTKDYMRKTAGHLNGIRTLLLEEMKTRKLLIPADLDTCVVDAAKDKNNLFYLFIEQTFNKRR